MIQKNKKDVIKMKILLKKHQKEIIQKISECQVICIDGINDQNAFDKITENLAEIALAVAGPDGITEILKNIKC